MEAVNRSENFPTTEARELLLPLRISATGGSEHAEIRARGYESYEACGSYVALFHKDVRSAKRGWRGRPIVQAGESVYKSRL